jgi:hypothetical protein
VAKARDFNRLNLELATPSSRLLVGLRTIYMTEVLGRDGTALSGVPKYFAGHQLPSELPNEVLPPT